MEARPKFFRSKQSVRGDATVMRAGRERFFRFLWWLIVKYALPVGDSTRARLRNGRTPCNRGCSHCALTVSDGESFKVESEEELRGVI